MKVYLAAPYSSREKVAKYAAELRRIGFTVTSSWLDEKHEINAGSTGAAPAISDEAADAHVVADLRDIDAADLLVLFTEGAVLPAGQGSSGGRHVETGYAFGRNTRVLVVGEPENIFHRAKRVTVVPNWHEAVLELSSRLVRDERQMPRAALS